MKPVDEESTESSPEELSPRDASRRREVTDEERARKAIRKFTEGDADGERTNLSLRAILGGDILAGAWFRRQFVFIVMLVVFVIVYVSNRYASQQELIEIDNLQKQRIDEQYKAFTRSSELTERTRRSYIEEYLKTTHDSTLQTATVPPYTLTVDEE